MAKFAPGRVTKRRPSWSERLLAAGLAGLLLVGPVQDGWAAGKKHRPAAKPAKSPPAAKKPPRVAAPALGAADILPDEPGVRGRASFYGHGFQGRRTASGDRFDVRGFTGASNHFPLGAWVAVRRLDTDRCVAVRINDRMGASHGRVIDLSRGAAQELGMIGAGVALVRVLPLAARPGRPGRLPPDQCGGSGAAESVPACPTCSIDEAPGLLLSPGTSPFGGRGD